jgi:hypothetical protein
MNMHIGIMHEDRLLAHFFQEFEGDIQNSRLALVCTARPSGVAFAGMEWLMPSVILAYVTKSYFESFLKEMGKDHYALLKKGFNKLYEKVAGSKSPTITIVGTAGKVSKEQPYSLFFSVMAELPSRVKVKLLIPKPINQIEYEAAISTFLDFVYRIHNETKDSSDDLLLEKTPITAGTALIAYEVNTGNLIPIDPLAKHRLK